MLEGVHPYIPFACRRCRGVYKSVSLAELMRGAGLGAKIFFPSFWNLRHDATCFPPVIFHLFFLSPLGHALVYFMASSTTSPDLCGASFPWCFEVCFTLLKCLLGGRCDDGCSGTTTRPACPGGTCQGACRVSEIPAVIVQRHLNQKTSGNFLHPLT